MIYTVDMKKFTCDRTSFKPFTARTYTDEGFLRVPGYTARIGIQEYLASELGLTDRNPNDIVKVMRPSESVFDAESLESYDGADVTNDHPSELVNPTTFKNTVVGTVRTVGVQDGEHVKAELIIKDADAIRAVESGKVQLSAGYTAVYDEAPEGADYDFIQREIRINHVAIVPRGRGGSHVKIFDSNNSGVKLMKKVTLDSGKSVEVQDEATATLLTDTFDRLTKRAMDAESKADKMEAEKDAKDEELEEMKKVSSDEAIKQRIESVTRAALDAKRVAGKEFTCDSLDEVAIKRAALAVRFPKREWADKSADYVRASFDMEMEKEETEDEDMEKVKEQQKKAASDAASFISTTDSGQAVALNGMQKLQQERAKAGGK
jgi:uncharacterized protein